MIGTRAVSLAFRRRSACLSPSLTCRHASTSEQGNHNREGTIGDTFVSLGGGAEPLDPRFADIKRQLIAGHKDAVSNGWERLLTHLREEIVVVKEQGTRLIPIVDYADIASGQFDPHFSAAYKATGACVIRNVIPEEEALQMKADIRSYLAKNPHSRAFPSKDNPQVFEIYWSPSQLRARGHPNLLAAQSFLLNHWRADPGALVSTRHPVSYADRLRLRTPGDVSFALGPHVDSGSVERWEPQGYGLGGLAASEAKPSTFTGPYSAIWQGNWEEYDPWDAGARLGVMSDLYQGLGGCSMFRMNQGWLSMSPIRAGEGHLLVNPMLKAATAYFLLRPFFEAKRGPKQLSHADYLHPANWRMESETTSLLQGANPGHGQELSHLLHPHLDLNSTMIHMPDVQPGDYVAWHCDTVHAVDAAHNGPTDSSVLYIPTCPLTTHNAACLRRQRQTFLSGVPSPDFGGGEGESNHVGRPTAENAMGLMDLEGLRAMGLAEWDSYADGLTTTEREVMDRANKELGFYA